MVQEVAADGSVGPTRGRDPTRGRQRRRRACSIAETGQRRETCTWAAKNCGSRPADDGRETELGGNPPDPSTVVTIASYQLTTSHLWIWRKESISA